MSSMSLSRAGYANQRSPAALAAAIALNGGFITLLIAIPAATIIVNRVPPTPTHWVKLTPPPPVIEEHKPRPEVNRTQKPVEQQVMHADPFIPEPLVPITLKPAETGGFIQPQPILDDGLQQTEQHVPIFVAARPDPRYAEAFHPDYPPALRREGLEGSVTVRVTIDERGRVIAVDQVRATSPAFFEETRRQALAEWRFRPATRDGVAVRGEQTMTVHFRLEE